MFCQNMDAEIKGQIRFAWTNCFLRFFFFFVIAFNMWSMFETRIVSRVRILLTQCKRTRIHKNMKRQFYSLHNHVTLIGEDSNPYMLCPLVKKDIIFLFQPDLLNYCYSLKLLLLINILSKLLKFVNISRVVIGGRPMTGSLPPLILKNSLSINFLSFILFYFFFWIESEFFNIKGGERAGHWPPPNHYPYITCQ
jgi:hypothetical protein